jgi:hypothetical protein
MKQRLTFRELKHLLDRSAAAVDRSTADRLSRARAVALQHQRAESHGWFSRGGVLHGHTRHEHRATYRIALLVFAVLLIATLGYWQQPEHEHVDLDIAILTDDMPVDVYIDQDE